MCNRVCLGICALRERAGLAKPMGPVDGFMYGKRCQVPGGSDDPETSGPATEPDVLLFQIHVLPGTVAGPW